MNSLKRDIETLLLKNLELSYKDLRAAELAADEKGNIKEWWAKALPEFLEILRVNSDVAKTYDLQVVLSQITTYAEAANKRARQTKRDKGVSALARADALCEQILSSDNPPNMSDIKAVWNLIQQARHDLK